MRSLVLLLVCALATSGAGKKMAKKAPTAGSTAKVILQLEREWVRAAATQDRATVERILADDWTSTDFRGKTVTKAQAISELQGANVSASSIELGEMKVRVAGTTAIVTGRDRSLRYAWMDVFLKRNGRWQAVASQSTRIEE